MDADRRYRIHFRTMLLVRSIAAVMLFAVAAVAQVPTVEKVDPPSWWVGSTINPVRVLVKGKNLSGSRIESSTPGISAANFKASGNGNYLFADIRLAENVRPGKYDLRIVSDKGSASFVFEVFQPLPRLGNYQGFSQDDVIYFVFTDRFADGDPTNNDPARSKGLYDRSKGRHYHGGDLQGVIDKLGYIKSLGATAIWTTPVYDNADIEDKLEVYPPEMPTTTGFHGYGAIDFYAVDEHLGDMAKLKEFVRKAHQAGFVVLQDQVVNHTGPYHPWAKDPPTPTWFNGTVEDHIPNNWQKWTAMNPRASAQTKRSNIDGWFIDILPDLNQNDPEVERYLIQNSLWWMAQTGFDGIRMDTLPHVPRSFWSKWSAAVHREFPKAVILGELFDSDPVLLSYFQKGRRGHDGIDAGIDTLYDFGLFYPLRNAFAQGKPLREVSQMFARDWIYPRSDVLVTFLGLHDMPRFMHEPGATTAGLKLAQTLIMTSRGTPLLYYGDEIAMPGGPDPDNRRDFPGGFPGDKRNAFTAAGRTAEENDVWNHLAKLGEIRKQYKSLRRGQTLDLYDGEQQIAYARFNETEAVLVVFNNDTNPAEIAFDISELKPFTGKAALKEILTNGGDVNIANGNVKIAIPARGSLIFAAK
ncbi:MAG: cyclomaltodextrinase N-terminal domain-containing protein [Acidobacteria bacterium]|nr:cyclomaltodextrinase N-terminal domain-containing protein [Acidobacteriota bacterium]